MIDHLIAEYNEESARITQERLLAWSSASVCQSICGVEMEPLTARAWVDLRLAENAFVIGGVPTTQDVCAYYWRNSAQYAAKRTHLTEKAQEALGATLGKQDLENVILAAYEHSRAAFEEIPVSTGTNGGKVSRNNGLPAVEGIVCAVDEVAHRYGRDPADVLDWPLNRIFQLQKAIRIATIENYKLAQPESLMNLRREYLTELNNG